MFDERGEPTDAQYLEWNEANDANDDGRAVAEAERKAAEAEWLDETCDDCETRGQNCSLHS